jgi:hypothetical protein
MVSIKMKLLVLAAIFKAAVSESVGGIPGLPELKSLVHNHPLGPMARSLQAASCSVYDVERTTLTLSALPNTMDSFTNGDDESPIDIQCEETGEMCTYKLYQVEDVDTFDDFNSYAPIELTEPCVRCELIYESTGNADCNTLSCDLFQCLPPNDVITRGQHGTRNLQQNILSVDVEVPTANETCNGTLYGIGLSGDMHQIDKATGELTFIANTGIEDAYAGATDSQGRLWVMTKNDPKALYEINATDWSYTMQVVTGIPSEVSGVASMAIDSQDNLFAVVVIESGLGESSIQDIYMVDLVLGNSTVLARDVGSLQGCAIDTSVDDMFCMDKGTLIKIDPNSGEKAFEAEIPFNDGSGSSTSYDQAVEFDPCTRTLWMSYSGLASYDLNNGNVTEVGEFENRWIFGLFFTFDGALPTAGTLPSSPTTADLPTAPPIASTLSTDRPTTAPNRPTPPSNRPPTNRPTSRQTVRPTPPPSDSEKPEEVTICFESSKYYTMGIDEVVDDTGRTLCYVWPTVYEYLTEYTKGVTNVQEIADVYEVKEDPLNPGESIVECKLMVNGLECNTCEICATGGNLDGYEVDCTNVAPGAVTSCNDVLGTSGVALLVLQEG